MFSSTPKLDNMRKRGSVHPVFAPFVVFSIIFIIADVACSRDETGGGGGDKYCENGFAEIIRRADEMSKSQHIKCRRVGGLADEMSRIATDCDLIGTFEYLRAKGMIIGLKKQFCLSYVVSKSTDGTGGSIRVRKAHGQNAQSGVQEKEKKTAQDFAESFESIEADFDENISATESLLSQCRHHVSCRSTLPEQQNKYTDECRAIRDSCKRVKECEKEQAALSLQECAEARRKCYPDKICEDTEKIEQYLYYVTALYVSHLVITKRHPKKVRKLLVGALIGKVTADNLKNIAEAISEHAQNEDEQKRMLTSFILFLHKDVAPDTIGDALINLANESSRKSSKMSKKRVSRIAEAIARIIAKQDITEEDAGKIVSAVFLSFKKNATPGEIEKAIRIAAYVRDDAVLKEWRKALKELEKMDLEHGRESRVPVELKKELQKKEFNYDVLGELLRKLDNELVILLMQTGGSMAMVLEDDRNPIYPNTSQNNIIIFASNVKSATQNKCGEPVSFFEAAIKESLTQVTMRGIKLPISVTSREFAAAMDWAECTCTGGSNCDDTARKNGYQAAPDIKERISGKCEGIFGFNVTAKGNTAEAVGEARLTLARKDKRYWDKHAASRRMGLDSMRSMRFGTGCSLEDDMSQREAAVNLLRRMQYRYAFLIDPPLVTLKLAPNPAYALLSPGLPWLMDGELYNDRRGTVLTVIDTTLLAGGIAALYFSIRARNEYAENSGKLKTANTLSWTATSAFGTALVFRGIATLIYKRKYRRH
ncbi:MAG: hypothetical protein JXR76_24435 [Deltaproteobacteria bacterium]|nr:hypothetical protein [Deltaproteobacteria bacterium]